MSLESEEIRYINWCEGSKKRTSNYTGDIFLTKKDRRMFDRAFQQPRVHVRRSRKARRAKPL